MIHKSTGSALPATKSTFNGNFERANFEKNGNGFTVEGKIVELRNHTLQSGGKYHRFLAVVVDFISVCSLFFNNNCNNSSHQNLPPFFLPRTFHTKKAKNRIFDSNGIEVESEQQRTVIKQKGWMLFFCSF